MDLEQYNILDLDTKNWLSADRVDKEELKGDKIKDQEKIWRIKSLIVSVDQESLISLLPLPESQRDKTLIETRYKFKTYLDLKTDIVDREEQLVPSYQRLADKTEEEVDGDAKRKRRAQY